MVRCPACSAESPAESIFCPKCGHRLTDPAPKPPATAKDKLLEAAAQRQNGADAPEEKLWEGGYSAKAMIGGWLTAGLVSLGVLAAAVALTAFPLAWLGLIVIWPVALGIVAVTWLWLGGAYLIEKWSIHYELTTQRFIHRSGLLARTTDRIEVIDIDDVTFRQGLVQRMLGVGTISITSSDRTHPTLVLKGIDGVQRVADLIDDTRRRERRRRGLHIEQV